MHHNRTPGRLTIETLESRHLLAVFTVTNLVDGPVGAANDIPGSLRQAIFDANAAPGADEIVWAAGVTGTVTLSAGELLVDDDLTITGPGHANMALDGNRSSRVVNIDDADVVITGLTITGGVADDGAGIQQTGILQFYDGVISGNTAVNDGGGLLVRGTTLIDASTIAGNAAQDGAGVNNSDGTLVVVASSVHGNSASRFGGGIYNNSMNVGSFAEACQSTISQNSAAFGGGGFLQVGELRLIESTVTENAAPSGQGAGMFGQFSGGISRVRLGMTIVSGNDGTDIDGRVFSGGTNLVGTGGATVNFGPPTNDIVGLPAELGPLADNGGPTLTHALLPGSPAIDAGVVLVSSLCLDPDTDQRGLAFDRQEFSTVFSRPVPDIGAFELPDGDFNEDQLFDEADIDSLIVAIADGNSPLTFDLNGDRVVDLSDRDRWLMQAGAKNLPSANPYLLGDANLDGVVDGVDFTRWNDNKFTATVGWTTADFNADGAVDGQDFLHWNDNKFTAAFQTTRQRFAEDRWKQVQRHKDRPHAVLNDLFLTLTEDPSSF